MASDFVGSELWRKMVSGERYCSAAPEILAELNRVHDLLWEYNQMRPSALALREAFLKALLGKTGERLLIEQPFFCDYGSNFEVGEDFYANYHLTVLDVAPVKVGRNAFFGPNVGLYTACHPTDAEERARHVEWARPITIGDDVWLGGDVTVCPGVTIGSNVVVGAGSVVVKDIEADSVAVGNPARVIRKLR